MLAGFAGAEADKLVETKGEDFYDRERVRRGARQVCLLSLQWAAESYSTNIALRRTPNRCTMTTTGNTTSTTHKTVPLNVCRSSSRGTTTGVTKVVGKSYLGVDEIQARLRMIEVLFHGPFQYACPRHLMTI